MAPTSAMKTLTARAISADTVGVPKGCDAIVMQLQSELELQ
jgi:hypothetical protein